MDVVGVIVLFFNTSPRHFEAEISVRLIEDFTPGPDEEWTLDITPAEHELRLSSSKRRVMWTYLWIRVAIALIGFGFILQAIALFV